MKKRKYLCIFKKNINECTIIYVRKQTHQILKKSKKTSTNICTNEKASKSEIYIYIQEEKWVRHQINK